MHRAEPIPLLSLALIVVVAAGCLRHDEDHGPVPPGRREVAVRVSDLLYGHVQIAPGTTTADLRAKLDDDFRVVLDLGLPNALPNPTRTHNAVTVDVPPNAALEFSYGVEGPAGSPPVTFRITARQWGLPRIVFEDTLTPGEARGWKDAVVNLVAWQGSTKFRFRSVEAGWTRPAERTAVFIGTPLVTVPTTRAPLRNLLLISLDTLRADHLGIYGYPRATSPNMDRIFSEGGVVVDRVVSQATDTFNSHMTLMTGMNPTTAIQPLAGHVGRQEGWATTLAEQMRHRGYRTAAFTEDGMLIGLTGFANGFDTYHETRTFGASGQRHGDVEDTFRRGLAWLERHRDDDVFLFLHTYAAHDPYFSPPAYADRFPTPPDASLPQRENDAYDRAIAYADDQVRDLLERVDALGLADRTMVVITADHGEEFGEHGGRRHGAHLASEILHVPLLMRGVPGIAPGTRRSGPMGLVDVTPTLLDLFGIPRPRQCEGRSMAAHLRSGDAPDVVPLFSESHASMSATYGGADPSWRPPGYAMTRWPHRLVRYKTDTGARYELYDLERDPGEHHDLYPELGPTIDADRQALESYPAVSVSRKQALALELTGRPESKDAGEVPVDPEVAAKLKALGYVR